jgi:hypothetical protein
MVKTRKNAFVYNKMFVYYNGESESLEKCCVYYESIKRAVNMRLIYVCQCDERLKGEGSIRLTYTGFRGGLYYRILTGVALCCLLLIDKTRAKDKTYT